MKILVDIPTIKDPYDVISRLDRLDMVGGYIINFLNYDKEVIKKIALMLAEDDKELYWKTGFSINKEQIDRVDSLSLLSYTGYYIEYPGCALLDGIDFAKENILINYEIDTHYGDKVFYFKSGVKIGLSYIEELKKKGNNVLFKTNNNIAIIMALYLDIENYIVPYNEAAYNYNEFFELKNLLGQMSKIYEEGDPLCQYEK
jgi:hypothetical protein